MLSLVYSHTQELHGWTEAELLSHGSAAIGFDHLPPFISDLVDGPRFAGSDSSVGLAPAPPPVPVVTDPGKVAQDLPMSVLSALLHHRDPEITAILEAMAPVLRDLQERGEDTAEIFIELTTQGLDKSPAIDFWRNLVAVDTSFFKSSLAEELRDEGRAQGMAKGMAEGIAQGVAEGLAQGKAKGRAEDILFLLDRRGIEVSERDRHRIASCDDLDVLARWFDRAITASSAAEIFTEAEEDA